MQNAIDSLDSRMRNGEAGGSQVFQGNSLPYRRLVQQVEALASSKCDEKCDEQAQEDFLENLRSSCQVTSRTYTSIAKTLVKQGSGARRWWARKLGNWDVKVKNPSIPQSSTSTHLMQKLAAECLQFAEINKEALGLVVGLYERQVGDGKAKSFLNRCWDPLSKDHAHFLMSPYTEELRALALILPPTRSVFCGLVPSRGADGNEDDELSEEAESVLNCPICFEVKYKPIALACGHSFCKMCLLDSSNLTTVVANNMETKLRVADRHMNAKCPMCKRTGVFEAAMDLKAVDSVASEV